MEEIIIQEKPDWVEWDDIHDILYNAHKENRDKGNLCGLQFLQVTNLKNA